jgi:hypothetical protein
MGAAFSSQQTKGGANMSKHHYANAYFRVFFRNPLLKLAWVMFIFAPILFVWGTSAKSLSGWLLSISGLSDEYEALFMGGCFLATGIIAYKILEWIYNRYEKWRAERHGLDM